MIQSQGLISQSDTKIANPCLSLTASFQQPQQHPVVHIPRPQIPLRACIAACTTLYRHAPTSYLHASHISYPDQSLSHSHKDARVSSCHSHVVFDQVGVERPGRRLPLHIAQASSPRHASNTESVHCTHNHALEAPQDTHDDSQQEPLACTVAVERQDTQQTKKK